MIAEAVLSSTHAVILTFDTLEKNLLLPHALEWIVAALISPHKDQINLSAEALPSALIFTGYFSA